MKLLGKILTSLFKLDRLKNVRGYDKSPGQGGGSQFIEKFI